jgi:hypothetical protein
MIVLAVALGLAAADGNAQTHAHGSAWIHPNADHATIVHAEGDSLCLLEFPDRCFGGMMAPDSVHCEFSITPPESLPSWCPGGYDVDIHDPGGESMMGEHMMPHGFFQRSLPITIHYDVDAVAAAGIDLANLALVRRTSAGYEVVETASHDPQAAIFQVSTGRLASWYGVADRWNLPVPVEQASWGKVKARYR